MIYTTRPSNRNLRVLDLKGEKNDMKRIVSDDGLNQSVRWGIKEDKSNQLTSRDLYIRIKYCRVHSFAEQKAEEAKPGIKLGLNVFFFLAVLLTRQQHVHESVDDC